MTDTTTDSTAIDRLEEINQGQCSITAEVDTARAAFADARGKAARAGLVLRDEQALVAAGGTLASERRYDDHRA